MDGKPSDWRPGPTVCRCCLTEGCYKDISTEYFWMGKREVYSEMLSETLNVSIAYSKSGGPNSNSRLICEPCIARLRDAAEFKRQVIDCEKTFMNHLDPGSSSKSKEPESIGEVKVELVKREKESISDDDFDDRPGFLDVDTDDDLDDQPLTKLASKIPKKEAVDILDLLDSSQITVKRKTNLKVKEPPKKIVKKKEVVKPSASKPAPKPADKKKDDEWTETDMRDPVDNRHFEDMKANKHSDSQDEWSTTDLKDITHYNERQSLGNIEESQLEMHQHNVVDEWVVDDTRNEPQPGAKHNVDDEWVTIDIQNDPHLHVNLTSIKETDREWIITDTAEQNVDKDLSEINSQVGLKNSHITNDNIRNRFSSNVNDHKLLKLLEGDCVAVDRGDIHWDRFKRYGFSQLISINVLNNRNKQKNSNDRIKIVKRYDRSSNIARRKIFSKNALLILKHTTAIPIKMANANSYIPCFACQCKFLTPWLFKEHILAVHPNADKSKGMNYFNNVQTRADITDLACLLCKQLCVNLEEIALHLVVEHKIDINLKEKLGLVPLKFAQQGVYECFNCQRKCMSFRDLYRHSGSHFSFYICEFCGDHYESFSALKYHKSRKHVDGHKCQYCRTVFPTTQELRQHVKEVDRCSPGYCRICKKSCGYNAVQLQKHKETVHGAPKKIYECSVCSKVFEKQIVLYLHYKKEHTDHCKCECCGKRFSCKKSLRLHALVHTDERPFKCNICELAFKSPSYLRTHTAKCLLNSGMKK